MSKNSLYKDFVTHSDKVFSKSWLTYADKIIKYCKTKFRIAEVEKFMTENKALIDKGMSLKYLIKI